MIEGPPGTGKTETILNLIANVIAEGSATIGVVSFGNSAVDNVREKLENLGFGHVVGRQEIDAQVLELQHFEKHVSPGELAQLDRLPLLRR